MKPAYVSAGFGNMIKAMFDPAFRNPANTFVVKASSEASGLKTIQKLKAAFPSGASFLTSQQAADDEGMRGRAGICLLGVKPQIFSDPEKFNADELPGQFQNPTSLLVSIMAGTTIAKIRSTFPNVKSGIRTMPNTPAKVGQGTIGTLQFGEKSRLADTFLVDAAASSLVIPLSTEDQFHAFTAVAGSGPAFAFTLIEHLEQVVAAGDDHDAADTKETAIALLREEIGDILKTAPIAEQYRNQLETFVTADRDSKPSQVNSAMRASVRNQLEEYVSGSVEGAEKFGLEADIALPSTLSTVLGSATLYERSSESLPELRDTVTSKGGTTFAGLGKLLTRSPEGTNVGPISKADMQATIAAAAERSKELSLG